MAIKSSSVKNQIKNTVYIIYRFISYMNKCITKVENTLQIMSIK